LAMQETLSNLFAGIQVILARKVRVGDYIKLDSGAEGYVTDISWRNTTVRALANHLIVVPNSKLASSVTTNFNLPDQPIAVLVEVGVAYNSDLQKVERVTLEVVREVMRSVPGGLKEFEPLVRFHTFGDSAINFTVVLRADEYVSQYLIKHEFIKRLQERYRLEGIEIPYPQRVVHLPAQTPPKGGIINE